MDSSEENGFLIMFGFKTASHLRETSKMYENEGVNRKQGCDDTSDAPFAALAARSASHVLAN
jgi:hypothetical protein